MVLMTIKGTMCLLLEGVDARSRASEGASTEVPTQYVAGPSQVQDPADPTFLGRDAARYRDLVARCPSRPQQMVDFFAARDITNIVGLPSNLNSVIWDLPRARTMNLEDFASHFSADDCFTSPLIMMYRSCTMMNRTLQIHDDEFDELLSLRTKEREFEGTCKTYETTIQELKDAIITHENLYSPDVAAAEKRGEEKGEAAREELVRKLALTVSKKGNQRWRRGWSR